MQLMQANAEFQFTHPGRGATEAIYGHLPEPLRFNSRTPGGVRPKSDDDDGDLYLVSIHAPREGCDFNAEGGEVVYAKFQFTHPGRGATITLPFHRD